MSEDRMPVSNAALLPMIVTLLGLVIFTANLTITSFSDNSALSTARDGQNAAVNQSTQLRNKLTGLAGQLAQLAIDGDSEAQAIVNNYAKNGIKFTPPTKPAAPAK